MQQGACHVTIFHRAPFLEKVGESWKSGMKPATVQVKVNDSNLPANLIQIGQKKCSLADSARAVIMIILKLIKASYNFHFTVFPLLSPRYSFRKWRVLLKTAGFSGAVLQSLGFLYARWCLVMHGFMEDAYAHFYSIVGPARFLSNFGNWTIQTTTRLRPRMEVRV